MGVSKPERPFPGLRSFNREEGSIFFGRAAQIDEMLLKLEDHRFLAVVGASGAGKSSLVKAGLLPALERGLLKELRDWCFVISLPGSDPIANLANELVASSPRDYESGEERLERAAVWEASLRRGRFGLARVLSEELDSRRPILILIDQFEELFRYRRQHRHAAGENRPKNLPRADFAERNEAVAFVNLLLEVSRQPNLDAYLVITMRSDFLGDCNAFFDLPEAINESQFLTPRLTPEQLCEAIERPLKVFDAICEPDLVSQVINDVGDDPDQLPLMQHCLMRCWDRTPKHLTLAGYRDIGGMEEALSRHADAAYDEFEGYPRQQEIAQRLFRSLCEPDRERRFTRRPTKVAEVAKICECDPGDVNAVVDVFHRAPRHFLVKREPEGMVDISHEVLIWQWKKLGDWLEDEAESVKIYQRLIDYTRSWKTRKAEEAELLPALQREETLAWNERESPNATWAARYHHCDDVKFEEAIGFLELNSQNWTHRELLSKDPVWTVALSRDGKTLASAGKQGIIRLWNARRIGDEPLASMSASSGLVNSLAFDPSGVLLASAGEDQFVKLWDCQHPEFPSLRDRLSAQTTSIWTLAFSLDGRYLAAAGDDHLVRIWDLQSSEESRFNMFRGHEGAVWSVAFHPNQPILASAGADRTVKFWDLSTFAPNPVRNWKAHDGYVWKVAFSPCGSTLASAGADNMIKLWHTDITDKNDRRSPGANLPRMPKLLYNLSAHKNAVTALDFSPDGMSLASGSVDQKVLLWSVEPFRKDPVTEFSGHKGTVRAVAFWPDGHALVSAGADGAIKMWNPKGRI